METNQEEQPLPYDPIKEAREASKLNGSGEIPIIGPSPPRSIASPYGIIAQPKSLALPKTRGLNPQIYSFCTIHGFRQGNQGKHAIEDHIRSIVEKCSVIKIPSIGLTYHVKTHEKNGPIVILKIHPVYIRQTVIRVVGSNATYGLKQVSNTFIVNFIKEDEVAVLEMDSMSYVTVRGGADNWDETTERRFVLEHWAGVMAPEYKIVVLAMSYYQVTGKDEKKIFKPITVFYLYAVVKAVNIIKFHESLGVTSNLPQTLEIGGFSFECYQTITAALRHRYPSWNTLLGRPMIILYGFSTQCLDILIKQILESCNGVLFIYTTIHEESELKLNMLISDDSVSEQIKIISAPYLRMDGGIIREECTPGTMIMRQQREFFTLNDALPSAWITVAKESIDTVTGLEKAATLRASATDWQKPKRHINVSVASISPATMARFTSTTTSVDGPIHPSFHPPRMEKKRGYTVQDEQTTSEVTTSTSMKFITADEFQKGLMSSETRILSEMQTMFASFFRMHMGLQTPTEMKRVSTPEQDNSLILPFPSSIMEQRRNESSSEQSHSSSTDMEMAESEVDQSKIPHETVDNSPKRLCIFPEQQDSTSLPTSTAATERWTSDMATDESHVDNSAVSYRIALTPGRLLKAPELKTERKEAMEVEDSLEQEEEGEVADDGFISVAPIPDHMLPCLTPEDNLDMPYCSGSVFPLEVQITPTQKESERFVDDFETNPWGFEVKQSIGMARNRAGSYNIPIGMGLFTRNGVAKGERLWFQGERVGLEEVLQLEAQGKGGYAVQGKGGIYIDGWSARQAGDYASAINSHVHIFIPTLNVEAVPSCSIHWSTVEQRPYYIFTRHVKPGEEIYGRYGSNYRFTFHVGVETFIIPLRSLTLLSKADQMYAKSRLNKLQHQKGDVIYRINIARSRSDETVFEILAHASRGDFDAVYRHIMNKTPFLLTLATKIKVQNLITVDATGFCGYDSLYYAYCIAKGRKWLPHFSQRRALIAEFLAQDSILLPHDEHSIPSFEEWEGTIDKLNVARKALENGDSSLPVTSWLPSTYSVMIDPNSPKFIWQDAYGSISLVYDNARSPTGELTLADISHQVDKAHTHIYFKDGHYQPMRNKMLKKEHLHETAIHLAREVVQLFYHV